MTFWEESLITRLVLLVANERLVSKESVIPRRGEGQTLNFLPNKRQISTAKR